MKRRFKHIIAVMLITFFAINITAAPALAASKNYTTGGDGKTAATFTVKTDSNSKNCKLTFEQKKGVYSYQNILTGTSTSKQYSRFVIYAQELGGSAKAYCCSYTDDITVSLKKNTTYKISIVPTENQLVFQHLLSSKKLKGASFLGWDYGPGHWSSYPTWTISSKSPISNISFQNLDSNRY